MKIPSHPLCNLTRVTADVAISGLAGRRVFRVELYATSDACNIELHDAANGSGTEVWKGVAPFTGANGGGAQSMVWDWTHLGGIPFPTTGIYADITGTDAVAFVWWQ
jgi:hypothetical protein